MLFEARGRRVNISRSVPFRVLAASHGSPATRSGDPHVVDMDAGAAVSAVPHSKDTAVGWLEVPLRRAYVMSLMATAML
jgi:hypothetical protein